MSFVIAAPASGSGKTTITLGLLRALTRRGVAVRGAKSGPDYIDPRFHAAACGRDCLNLDAWAMTPDRVRSLAGGDTPLIVEGAMGLFDGAPPDGNGSTAALARILNLPVVLVVDAARMAQSVVPLVTGFARHDPDVTVAGVILNRVGSPRHANMLRDALEAEDIRVFAAMPRTATLNKPSRYLGLQQAQERPELDADLNEAADLIDRHVDLTMLPPLIPVPQMPAQSLTPPAQTIAIASDVAFGFSYPHMVNDWRDHGATVTVFSPLNNDPVPPAEFVFLPGGYPELHAGHLAAQSTFLTSLRQHKGQIYGECGGYMTLGETLTDADGITHKMAGLLPLGTSIADRKLHLGYRTLATDHGPFAGHWHGHEFHYATTTHATGAPLFRAKDAAGTRLADMGLINGRVSGSFAHLIDRAP